MATDVKIESAVNLKMEELSFMLDTWMRLRERNVLEPREPTTLRLACLKQMEEIIAAVDAEYADGLVGGTESD